MSEELESFAGSVESKLISWKIENLFSVLTNGSSQEKVFIVGDTIGCPVEWTIKFTSRTIGHREFKGFLCYPSKRRDGIKLLLAKTTFIMYHAEQGKDFEPLTTERFMDYSDEYDVEGDKSFGFQKWMQSVDLKGIFSWNQTLLISIRFKMLAAWSNKSWKNVLLNTFAEGRMTDVTLVGSDGTEVLANKCLLAAHSPVFLAMFDAQDMKEAQENRVEIKDISGSALENLLNFIYTGELKRDCDQVCEEVLYTAEKYQIKSLKEHLDLVIGSYCTPHNALKLFNLCIQCKMRNGVKDVGGFMKNTMDKILEVTVEEMGSTDIDVHHMK